MHKTLLADDELNIVTFIQAQHLFDICEKSANKGESIDGTR
jgi:hypothetical protein